ncbi:MAG: DUF4982 domain-containing protein [Verrucomicrobiae bacterium]|nr:DUF4982 domain-containing protein [Verrucomicrobiae bacterium]
MTTKLSVAAHAVGIVGLTVLTPALHQAAAQPLSPRERILINSGWRFTKADTPDAGGQLLYDVRPEVKDRRDDKPADAEPTDPEKASKQAQPVLKPWILPTANPFIKDAAKRHTWPAVQAPSPSYAQPEFDDSSWRSVDLPHDWAIEGPFDPTGRIAGGGMGRLPSPGVGWYRKKLDIPASDAGKCFFLDVDGAMSYAAVWCNGRLVGGWPYGYASWRLDLTPYIKPGEQNVIAIRLDNPPDSSRWYPGGGIYRNVWLTKTHPVHVAHWGTWLVTSNVSSQSADVHVEVTVENATGAETQVTVVTEIYPCDHRAGRRSARPVAATAPAAATVPAGGLAKVTRTVRLASPQLWGPPPTQKPNLYLAVTKVWRGPELVDQYETRFGIRDVQFDPDKGVIVNGERIPLKGVNLHHDLGALGAAFNRRAAQRQLELLREMGCNAIRTAHNPPAPELLDLTDEMGFLVVDEIFDCWERKKTPLDFHLIFPDWHEPDLRAFIRRDRNHPSVILWSIGNEVGEQYTGERGAAVAKRLYEIAKEEDPTRPVTTAMNWAKPDMPLPAVVDVIGLNYQGEGIRDTPPYAGLKGITTPPQYAAFRKAFPNKVILSTETAAAVSTRGTYLFPVFDGISAPVKDGQGGDPKRGYVSAYELYTADFGASPDKVFAALDKHPFVAGEFVWSGFDYLGEPTPYYSSRSSYFGILDLAGFKKDRFYLYQSRWRPDLPMVHILPHWTWPDRIGQITPVHVFTSGDEVELFLNGKSLGRKKKGPFEYRLRWDDVVYEPGTLKAVAYKNGKRWAESEVRTAGAPARLELEPDRKIIVADGSDLCFVTVKVTDKRGATVPAASNRIHFSLEGPGEIVATDNGDPTDFDPFPSHSRKAFNGLCLVIVRGKPGQPGTLNLVARAEGLKSAAARIRTSQACNRIPHP